VCHSRSPLKHKQSQINSGHFMKLSNDRLFRRLIRQVGTGLYYDGFGGWTERDSEAFAYKTMGDAIEVGEELDPESLLLVLKFLDTRLDVQTPILNLITRKVLHPVINKATAITMSLLPLASDCPGAFL
jgi:hypothetical protein